MASPGAIAELARLPPSRKALVFALIGLVIGLGYWKLVYQSLDEQVDAASAEHDKKLQTNKRLAGDLTRYEELRTHMAKLRELIEKNQTALPKEAEVPAFFETLQRKVAESGVEIHRWAKRNEEPVESFVKVPVEIELTGTFMQIKRFFASLIQRDVRLSPSTDDRANEPRERIVSIENLALNNPTLKNRELILTAKFIAVTFRQEDPPVAPDKSPNGQPAGGAAKPPAPNPPVTPSTTPSPPLPSASPPGAKPADKAPVPGTRLGGRRPATPLDENAVAREPSSDRGPRTTQRAAQRRGWVTTRDRLHGRVVKCRSVVEMARTVGRNTVVDGRAADPDRDRQRACPRSPEGCASAQILCDTEVENANDDLRSSSGGKAGL